MKDMLDYEAEDCEMYISGRRDGSRKAYDKMMFYAKEYKEREEHSDKKEFTLGKIDAFTEIINLIKYLMEDPTCI